MIYVNNHEVEFTTFPNREKRLDLDTSFLKDEDNKVIWKYQDDADIFELLLFNNAMHQLKETYNLYIGYFPYSRMDRVENQNTAFSLKVLTSILQNELRNMTACYILDPHSPRTLELLNQQVVGSDLSCGMLSYCVGSLESIDLKRLDKVVHEQVPSGQNVHTKSLPKQLKDQTEKLINQLSFDVTGDTKGNLLRSMGTLGGGNHFLELSKGQDGKYWLTVHSGSRGFGGLIAKHHSKVARLKDPMLSKQIENGINFLKYHGRHHEIQGLIQDIKREYVSPQIPYLMDQELNNYLHDVNLAHQYADLSRRTMLNNICQAMGWEVKDQINSVHNYIDLESNIIRKGATSAKLGERLLIPLNMRDGMLICKGLGNADWNQSAPHGAGRILSRSQAKAELDLEHYQAQMQEAGVYTTSVGQSTLDEAPDAYKPAEQIKELIGTTVEILDQTKPVYNFKAH